ncbi:MAG: hypothetical protein EXX96DRAFT_471633 [Benjaminiella poitrasii]|nr:MAG: hypothetical protein EXX96DRAFT_471633 [Benjaminiella poitrasii]
MNASYFNFCQELNECDHSSTYTSIGQAYPAISYIMVDHSDNSTRMYPQPLLKQFKNLSVKPNWVQYDINAHFNSKANWYFVNDSSEINENQTDFLRNVIHEIIHGLGFITSWTDNFYSDLVPLFPSDIDHFITPFLLASTENVNLFSNYSAPQPFWGFVEFPFDKFLAYVDKSSSNSNIEFFTNITQQLNKFSNSNVMFRNMVDLANAWYKSDAYSLASKLYTKANTSLDVLAVVDNNPLIWLETSVPFSSGSSLCHVAQSVYLNTAEYLMVYLANKGVEITQLDQLFPQGPVGPKILSLMAALGYRVSNTTIKTTRPELSYWSPAKGLVGTDTNPNPSLSIETNGPARIPPPSVTTSAKYNSSASNLFYVSTCSPFYIALILLLLLL